MLNVKGAGKILIDNFTKVFGKNFDNTIHSITDYIQEGKIICADIEMNIIPTKEGYDIEIPEINSIYTHMLGSDCHSIIAGVEEGVAMIKTLKGYIVKNYNLICTSHHTPEDINAVEIKIAYIETVLNLASDSKTAEEMIEKIHAEYLEFSGNNYLEMSANLFYPKN